MAAKSGIPAYILALLIASQNCLAATRQAPEGFAGSEAAESAAGPAGSFNGKAADYLALGRQDFFWIPASILASIPAHFRYQGMAPVDTGALDRRDLWPMDRWLAGRYSHAPALASQILILPFGALPMALSAWDARNGRQTWSSAIADAVIYSEAIVLTSSLNLLIRSMRIHPRPYVYGSQAPAARRLGGEASGSFYSGHANGAFLAAVYFSYTYGLRHPESEYRGWIWAGSLGAASVISGLRMAGGRHFLSDVAAGAAVGAFFGWAFPRMHKARSDGEAVSMSVGWDHSGLHPRIHFRF